MDADQICEQLVRAGVLEKRPVSKGGGYVIGGGYAVPVQSPLAWVAEQAIADGNVACAILDHLYCTNALAFQSAMTSLTKAGREKGSIAKSITAACAMALKALGESDAG
ncbi:MAG: hypothetical protein AAGF35_13545 [Pseudomonadota bacterium]